MIKNLRFKTWTKNLKLMHLACFLLYSLCIEVASKDFQPIGTVNPSKYIPCLLYTSPSPRDLSTSRMPSSA